MRSSFWRRLHQVLLLPLFALAAIASAPFDVPSPMGTPPSEKIEQWVRLLVIGNTVEPPSPVIWIATQSFKRTGIDQLVVLPQKEYVTLLGLVHSYSCPIEISGFPRPRTLLITQFSQKKRRDLCVLPRADACGFLRKVEVLPPIHWTKSKLQPIRNLVSSIGC